MRLLAGAVPVLPTGQGRPVSCPARPGSTAPLSYDLVRRVPQLAALGEFARLNGARSLADLPCHVDAFVDKRVSESRRVRRNVGSTFAKDVRGPVEQMLMLVIPGYVRRERIISKDLAEAVERRRPTGCPRCRGASPGTRSARSSPWSPSARRAGNGTT
jgi:hypothetical protein